MAKILPIAGFLVVLAWAIMELSAPDTISLQQLPWLGLIALVSALGAAGLIEVGKRILLVRGIYQRIAFRRWVASGLDADRVDTSPKSRRAHVARAEDELLTLAGIESDRSRSDSSESRLVVRLYRISAAMELFDLPSEQFAAQLADAADRAVSDPERFPALAAGVAMGEKVTGLSDQPRLTKQERGESRATSRPPMSTAKGSSKLDAARDELRAAQTRAFAIAQKRVQAYQISTSRGWKRVLSVATVAICTLLTTTSTLLVLPDAIGWAVLLGLLVCPPVAWFIRDVAAGVERWRTS